MHPSLRGLGRRLAAVGPGFMDAFLRDNKVLPPIAALLALLAFAWIVAGTYLGGSDEPRVSNQANVVQPQDDQEIDPAAPEVENRDVDSYAAYRNKDPFRQLIAPAESTSGEPADATTQPPDDAGDTGDGPTGGRARGSQDSDNDGLNDSREAELFQDPQNPDTDGDGILDGADDADGDGQPDGTDTDAGDDTSGSTNGDASASPGASPDASPGASPDAGTGDGTGGGDDAADASAPPSGDDATGGGRDRPRDRPRDRDDDLLDSGGSLFAP